MTSTTASSPARSSVGGGDAAEHFGSTEIFGDGTEVIKDPTGAGRQQSSSLIDPEETPPSSHQSEAGTLSGENPGYQNTPWVGQAEAFGGIEPTHGHGERKKEEGEEEEGEGEEEMLQDVPIENGGTRSRRFSSIDSTRDADQEAYLVSPKDIPELSVTNPEKHGEGIKDSYVTYEIVTEWRNGEKSKVRRRYQDFIWLLSKLAEEVEGGVIIPPIPDKQLLDYMDRFSPDFIKKRQYGLERFLRRTLAHPRLSKHGALRAFLTQTVLVGAEEVGANTPIPKMESPSGMAAVIEKLSDAVINALASSSRAIDTKYGNMTKITDLLETHLERISFLHGKMASAFGGMSEALLGSSQALSHVSSGLGQLEKLVESCAKAEAPPGATIPIRSMIGDFGQLEEERSATCAKMAEDMELKAHRLFSELTHYCRGAKQALRLRDQKQFEWQDLNDHLSSAKEELANLTGDPARKSSVEGGEAAVTSSAGEIIRAHKSAVVNFFSEKIDSFRGVDPITSRAERSRKLQERIEELETALATSKDQSKAIDLRLEGEFRGFLAMTDREVHKLVFPNLLEAWSNFHQEELSLWTFFVNDTLDSSGATAA